MPGEMQGLTLTNFQATILFVIAACALLYAIWKGIEALRKLTRADERKAREDAVNARFNAIERRLTDAEERLERGDEKFRNISEDSEQTLTVLNAMLMHFISGNDHDKLKETKTALDTYLAKR